MTQERIYRTRTKDLNGWQVYEMVAEHSGQITHYAITETVAGTEYPEAHSVAIDTVDPDRYSKPVRDRLPINVMRSRVIDHAKRLMENPS